MQRQSPCPAVPVKSQRALHRSWSGVLPDVPHRALPTITLLVISLTMLPCGQVSAAPADWYRWQSKQTGRLICKQTSPGDGWQRHSGPYLDGGCRQPKHTPPTAE